MSVPQAWLETPAGLRRARGLGVPFEGAPGPNNAITDVAGVELGYTTLISGEGPLVMGQGPVRTGVTAILPRGRAAANIACMGGTFSLNGNGELTGCHWVEESGFAEGPITITNTHSCGLVRDGVIAWQVEHFAGKLAHWGLPIVGETYDGELNDLNGFHVTRAHVFAALDSAATGAIDLGSVGGGTGMICYDFKGGSGSASRRVRVEGEDLTLGVFLQCNFGTRPELLVAGVPVGRHLKGGEVRSEPAERNIGGSVIGVVITDAPLLPHQLKRLARRVALGLARTGALAHNGSGDIFIALSTANKAACALGRGWRETRFLANPAIDPLFEATVQATEEAVIDSMVANQTMTGANGFSVRALPHDELQEVLRRYGRLDAD